MEYTAGVRGVVSAGNGHTAAAAAEVLSAGGNAVDALVAGALASFVAEPLLASAGGAGMLTVVPVGAPPAAVDFFSTAPGRGGRPDALDFRTIEIDFGSARQVFHVGRGSAAVPLAFPGLGVAARRFGTLPLSDLVAPAVRLAREGVVLAREGALVFDLLWEIQRIDPAIVALHGVGGECPPAGALLRNPELADTMLEFAAQGGTPERVREGLLDTFGPDRGGLLSAEDLDDAAARVIAPHRFRLGDHDVVSSPGPGGHLVGLIAGALADGAAEPDEAAEVLRTALASLRGHQARGDYAMPGNTTHLSAIDDDGCAASMTLTNGEGCGFLVPGTGIQVNNFLGEEDLNPRGFHSHPPGTRLPTMLAPTIALKDGEPRLALGSGGSNRIRSAVSEVLHRVVSLGEELAAAVLAPRVHAEDRAVWVELEGLRDPRSVIDALEARFPEVYPFPTRAFFFGGVHAVDRAADGSMNGVGDPRRGGCAVEG